MSKRETTAYGGDCWLVAGLIARTREARKQVRRAGVEVMKAESSRSHGGWHGPMSSTIRLACGSEHAKSDMRLCFALLPIEDIDEGIAKQSLTRPSNPLVGVFN